MHDRDVGVREELSAQTHLDNEYYFMMLMDEAETVRANATAKFLQCRLMIFLAMFGNF